LLLSHRRRHPRHSRRYRPAFAHLLAPHGVVEAFALQEVGVAAGFDDVAPFEDVDAVGVEDGRQAVRDEDGDEVAGRHLADGLGDLLFGERIERGGGFVENEEARPWRDRPGTIFREAVTVDL
jgi:hypothetical protein